jgi:alcohol dehydrogenase class IV
MRFEFASSRRIIFGPGVLQEISSFTTDLGSRALVVTGRATDRATPLLDLLDKTGINSELFSVHDEPTIEIVRQGIKLARREACDIVIGFGGGSPLDTGKAIAALMSNGDDPLDFLEVIGSGKPLTQPSVPYIAIPTTAGTGSEVTHNAVLASLKHRVKVSLRSPNLLPRLAIVDPELTYSMPPSVTASTGLDALTQVLEPYLSRRANPFVDAFCREGMRRASRSLRPAYFHGSDIAAREDMSLASLFGGIALANAGLGAVHGFAGPFGGMFHAPHGATCAALLPHVMEINVLALKARAPHSEVLPRYDEVAQILTGNPKAAAEDGVTWLRELCQELQVPPLGSYGITEADFPTLIEKAKVSSSILANPISLTRDEMHEILQKAI